MGIRITNSPPGESLIDISDGEKRVGEATVDKVTDAAGGDSVARIAREAVAGGIQQGEVVARILSDAMGSSSLDALPDDLRRELEETLSMILESDPHLCGLAAAITPADPK